MDALERLLEGNKRFVEGNMKEKNMKEMRENVVEGQKPYATIITCSDSRVVPEYIFDAGIGELFIIRDAGNICGEYELGSIEYGVEHLETPVLVILGHSRCGAVTATCNACKEMQEKAGNNIDSIVEKIKPAVKEDVETSVDENMKCVEQDILERSPVTKKLVDEGKLKILRIKYLLETGEVKIME